MAIGNDPHPATADGRLEEAILFYLKGLDSGRPVTREQLARDYPDLEDQIDDFFADQESLRPVLAPLRQPRTLLNPVAPILRVFGPYDLIEEVGRGGMGVVYKARQRELGRLVALKVIRVGWLATAAETQRFHNEAETIAAVDHPHIVRIYDVGEHDGQCFFTMPWLDGGSLETDRLRWRKDHRAAAAAVACIARALHHAHQRGILHRDVKPSNVLMDAEGRVYLADFGLAKRLDENASLTETGAVVGTPGYLSPEQAAFGGAEVTTASDIYGLGAVLYRLLTGRPPFRAKTPLETISMVRSQDPRPLNSAGGHVDRDLDAICSKCLEKEPGRRYSSARALADDLERWLAGEPVLARKPSAAGRVWRWCRRNRAVAGMVAFVALAAIVGVTSLIAGLAVVNQARRAAESHRETAEQSASQLREHLYATNIALGFKLLNNDQAGELNGMLRQIAAGPVTPGFEWHYLGRQLKGRPREAAAFRGHRGIVYSATFTPDGKTVASCGEDRSVRIWDPATGEERLALWPDPAAESQSVQVHRQDEDCVAFSPDGKVLASSCEDGTVRIWDVETKAWTPLVPRLGGEALKVVFSPDGRRIAAAGVDPAIRIWDAASRRLLAELAGHSQTISHVDFHPDGRRMISADHNGHVRIWDLESRQSTRTFELHDLIRWVGFLPSGEAFVSAGKSGDVKLWSADDGKELAVVLRRGVQVRSVAISPDGKRIAVADDDGFVLVGPIGGESAFERIPAHVQFTWSVQFSPDGGRLLTSGGDRVARIFEFPEAASRPRARPADWPAIPGEEIGHLAISPSGSRVAITTSERGILLGDPSSRGAAEPIPVEPNPWSPVDFSADGNEVLYVDGKDNLCAWDTRSRRARVLIPRLGRSDSPPPGRPIRRPPEILPFRLVDGAPGVVDESGLLSILSDGVVRETRIVPGGWPHHYKIAEASPDGRSLALADSSATVTLLDVASLTPRWSIPMGLQATCIAFARAGDSIAIGLEDGTFRILEAAGGETIRTFAGHHLRIVSASFAPDGRTLASTGADGALRLWHVASGLELATLQQRTRPLSCLAFSPDGTRLLAAGQADKAGRNLSVFETED